LRASSAVRLVVTVAALAAGVSAVRASDKGPRADRIFINGHVWTGDPAKPTAEAIAVRATRIVAVGTSRQITQLASKHSDTVDLKGKWVFPGFNDAHLHFLVLDRADVSGCASVAEVQKRVADFARSHPAAAWVMGRGWTYADFPDRAPNRKLLDAVVPDRPVWITDRDGHAGWCNSRALELAGVTRSTPDPSWGTLVRDAKGEPTGLFKEAGAMDLVRAFIPPPNDEEQYRALKSLLDRAASRGLTSVQNASLAFDEMPIFQRVLDEGGLKVRFRWALLFDKKQDEDELARYKDLRSRMGGPAFEFGAAKAMVDGTITSRTAALSQPYATKDVGVPFWTQDDLNAAVAHYDHEGLQVLLHAVGDRGVSMALNAFEYAAKTNKTTGRRHRVEHAEVVSPSDIPRFKQLGVIASTQPLLVNPDKADMETYETLLGPDRSARLNPLSAWDDAGVVQAFGSDWPVTPLDPLRQMYAAVTRMTAAGTPPGGWHPENRVSAGAAVRHFTVDAAFAGFGERDKGTLAVGKLADFTVLSDDILQPPAERILNAKVLLTVMGGQDTWREAGF
jgi:predicted amidohydrolase YtcJ